MLADLGITVAIRDLPCEIADATPFSLDHAPRAYDGDAARRFHQALSEVDRVFKQFRTGFLGKASPVHFFWGSFDLAVTRFSGRRAPLHPGTAPGLAPIVMQEAYSHEVSSAGFWPGGAGMDASFYSYAYPEPPGFKDAPVSPAGAHYDETLREFVLPYEAVRTASDPDATLLAFLQSTYEAAANAAHGIAPRSNAYKGTPAFAGLCSNFTGAAMMRRKRPVEGRIRGSRMSPRCFGKVMTGGPVRSTGAPDMVPSRPAPAAVPEQRRRSTLEFHRIQRRADSQRMSPERRRLTYALLLSLLIHTLLLSLTFGGQGLWLPGFGFPWQDRRIEAPDLRVVVVPAQVTAAEPAVTPVAEPLQQARVEQPVASGPAPTPSVSRASDPAADCSSDHAGGQSEGRGQSKDQTPRPVRPLRKCLCAAIGPVTRRPRRSPRRP